MKTEAEVVIGHAVANIGEFGYFLVPEFSVLGVLV